MPPLAEALYRLSPVVAYAAPVLAFGLFLGLRNHRPWRARLAAACAIFLSVTLALLALGVGFADEAAQHAWILVFYAAYCLLACCSLQIGGRSLRAVVFALMAAPVALLCVAGVSVQLLLESVLVAVINPR